MKSTDKRLESLYLFLILAICSLPVIYGLNYIENYAVNVPYWDQWDSVVLWPIEYHEGDINIARLVTQQGDSRPAVSNAIILVTSISTDLNIKTLFYLGYILYVISILIIIYFLKSDGDLNFIISFLLIPIFYYAFNPYYLIRFIQNIGCIHYPILILTALMTVYLLHLSKDSNRHFFGSILMAVMCTFSFAAGLTIWFAGLFQLSIQNVVDKKSKIVIWLTSTFVVFYTYFIGLGFTTAGLHSTSAYESFVESFRYYPIQKFLCFMGTFGAQVIHQKEIALYFGLTLSMILFVLLYINRDNLEMDRFSKWYGLLAFGTLTSLEVALTRSGADAYFGPADSIFFVPEARHSLAIFLPIICIYILSILYTEDAVEKSLVKDSNNFQTFFRETKHLNLFLLGAIFLLISLGSILHVMPGIDGGRSIYNQQVANQYYLENYKIQPDKNLVKLHPSATAIRERASKLEKFQLSVFAKTSTNIYDYSKLNLDTYSCIDSINHRPIHLQKEPVVIDKDNEAEMTISGWAVDKHANSPAKAVFITIDDELNIPTLYGLDRPDVANAYNNKNFRYSGFRASFAPSILDEGPQNFTIKIVSKEGDGYYTSNQIVPFMIV